MRSYLDGRAMDDVAIERIRSFETEALEMHPNGYWLADSGGKDSCVILHLAARAGVKHQPNHSLTTADPPEIVQFLRKEHPQTIIHRPSLTMWQLIRKKQMPPRRTAKFCCEVLKEAGGAGRFKLTGVRAAESRSRAGRRMVEVCYGKAAKGAKVLHPIFDWPTDAVWEYIREHNIPHCRLYHEGFSRLGCVLCPETRAVPVHLGRWPKLCKAWERAVKATWTDKKRWPTAEAYWQWWLDRDAPSLRDDQPVIFEDDPSMAENMDKESE